jgi:hypothetical protein
MTGAKVAPASSAKGTAGGLGRERAVGAQPAPEKLEPPEKPESTTDLSRARSQQFGFRLCSNIPEALRCGGDRIAVDAVLTIVEQDDYPSNDRGQILLPSYDFFQQCVQVFEDEGRAVPYFNHKQLSFSFEQAQTMVKTANRLRFPMLAGSSLPVTWRLPEVDIPLGAEIEEAVMVGVGDGMDFDALEALQCMLERRKGGETGVKAVQLLEGDDAWAAGNAGRWSKELLSSALSRSDTPLGLTVLDGRTQDMVASGVLPQLVKNPAAYCIEYNDGTRATLLILNGAIMDFNIAARVAGHGLVSTQFFLPPAPNVTYSACLAAKIEQTFQTASAAYPVERTLLTTGMLEACLRSRHRLNQRLETPQLAVSYQPPAESQYART